MQYFSSRSAGLCTVRPSRWCWLYGKVRLHAKLNRPADGYYYYYYYWLLYLLPDYSGVYTHPARDESTAYRWLLTAGNYISLMELLKFKINSPATAARTPELIRMSAPGPWMALHRLQVASNFTLIAINWKGIHFQHRSLLIYATYDLNLIICHYANRPLCNNTILCNRAVCTVPIVLVLVRVKNPWAAKCGHWKWVSFPWTTGFILGNSARIPNVGQHFIRNDRGEHVAGYPHNETVSQVWSCF